MLDQVVEISEEEKEHLKQRLYYESKDMMHKFSKLFSATIRSLQKGKVAVKELIHIIEFAAFHKVPIHKDSKQEPLIHELMIKG